MLIHSFCAPIHIADYTPDCELNPSTSRALIDALRSMKCDDHLTRNVLVADWREYPPERDDHVSIEARAARGQLLHTKRLPFKIALRAPWQIQEERQ
jgi:hypothetical protein